MKIRFKNDEEKQTHEEILPYIKQANKQKTHI